MHPVDALSYPGCVWIFGYLPGASTSPLSHLSQPSSQLVYPFHYSAFRYTNRSDCNGFRGARFHPVTFSCSASPAALSDGDTVKIIPLAPTVTLRADHTAVQIEGEIRRASLLPSSSLPSLGLSSHTAAPPSTLPCSGSPPFRCVSLSLRLHPSFIPHSISQPSRL